MRRALALAFICVFIASLSCSATPLEDVATSSEAINGACGAVTATASFTTVGSGSNAISGSTRLLIPSQTSFAPTDVIIPLAGGGTITTTITFDSSTSCSYAVAIPTTGGLLPAPPAQFVSCTNGGKPGSEITASSSVVLSGARPANEDETFHATATLGIDVDDGKVCTSDTCSNGNASHSNLASGTVVEDGDPCNGIETCDGAGGFVAGTSPPATVTYGCATYTCVANQGYKLTTACTPPSGATSYDPTVVSNFATGASFIYSGVGATQKLANGSAITATIDAKRAAILRGRVTNRSGTNLQNVIVSVVSRPEYGTASYGQVATRADGYYDIVVNGGATYTLQYDFGGYVTAQRTAKAEWLDFTVLHDVVLVAKDSGTSIYPASSSWQVARGTQTSADGDPARRATVLFPPGTSFVGVTASGCSGTCFTMRSTEFTIGSNGALAMPADLPPQSGYTYAAELALDEADTQGVPTVTFSNTDSTYGPAYQQNVLFYLENFTGAGVGTSIPTGSYDRAPTSTTHPRGGQWSTEPNGVVLKVLSNNGTTVTLSTDGTNEMSYTSVTPQITSTERQQLAALYSTSTSTPTTWIWRVPSHHFSSWDFNWGAGPPAGAVPPPPGSPIPDTPKDDSVCKAGSIIECENQVVGEDVAIAGTPYSLHYRSETQNGYHPTIAIPVADGTSLPSSLKRIEAEVRVAGHDVVLQGNVSTGSTKRQTLYWTWDRTDVYGRAFRGATRATIQVRYVYGAVPFSGGKFASYYAGTAIGGTRSNREVFYARDYTVDIGAFDAAGLGLGGWTISDQHVYQPTNGVLFRGDGSKQTPAQAANVIRSWAVPAYPGNDADAIQDIGVGADGTMYFTVAGTGGSGIEAKFWLGKIDPLTKQTTIMSSNTQCCNHELFGDGDPIGNIQLDAARQLYIEPTGNILLTDYCRIIRVTVPDYKAYLVAGQHSGTCSTTGYASDGAVATTNALDQTYGAAALPDGSVIFLEQAQAANTVFKVRRIALDGTLETLMGLDSPSAPTLASCATTSCSTFGFGGNCCDPRAVKLPSQIAYGLAVGADGTIYVGDGTNERIWQLTAREGVLRSFAGNGTNGHAGDGVIPAASLPVATDSSVAINLQYAQYLPSIANGFVMIPEADYTVRRVAPNGVIDTLAGVKNNEPYHDGVAATQSGVFPVRVVFGPDGYYYTTAEIPGVSLNNAYQIVRFRGGDLGSVSGSNIFVASRDKSEIYKFDTRGQHVATLSPYRGKTLLTLGYNSNGQVTSLTDGDGNQTSVSGYGTSSVVITAPHGQTTTIALSGGYATSITNYNSEVIALSMSSSGLLQTLKDPNDATDSGHHTHTYSFTASGLLSSDARPQSGIGTELVRSEQTESSADIPYVEVDYSSPQGRVTSHVSDLRPNSSDTFTDAFSPPRTFARSELRTHTDGANHVTKDHRYTDGTKKIRSSAEWGLCDGGAIA